MPEIPRTIDLVNNTAITSRDESVNVVIYSLDINQIDGTYSVVEPYGSDDSYNGRVVIYPQSPVSAISPVELKTFNRVGSLYYPLDARFDYLRRKIWIADAGNDRVLCVNLNTNQVDVTIDQGVIRPHSLAIDFNTGNIFIKGYSSHNLSSGEIFYYKKDGTLLSTFLFNQDDTHSSSSSSSFEGSMSSSSSSAPIIIPPLPSSHSMAFDHVRSRLWWVDGVRIYMLDVRNQQVQTYDIRNNNFVNVVSLGIEFETGNSFVVSTDVHNDRFLVQMCRDNNTLISTAYIKR